MEQKFSQMDFFAYETKRLTASDARIAEDIRTILLNLKSGLVFDAGCGEGVFTNIAAGVNRGVYVVGGDLSKSALLRAKNHVQGENVDLIVCDIENLPFRNDLFDCIISINLLHHLPCLNPISEINRIGKNGSPFFISDHAYLSNPLFFTFNKVAASLPHSFLQFREDVGSGYETPRVLMYSFDHLMQTLELSRFKSVSVKKDILFFAPLFSIFKGLSQTFGLPFLGFLNDRYFQVFLKLDTKLKKYLYRFYYEFVICCINEKN